MASIGGVSGEGRAVGADHGCATAPGQRQENQDRAVASGWLGVVSDGIGGNAGGAVAASLTVDAVVAHLRSLGRPPRSPDVADAVARANAAVRAGRERDMTVARMGATVTLAVATGPGPRGGAGQDGDGRDGGAARPGAGAAPGEEAAPGGEAGAGRWVVANVGDSPAWLVTAAGCDRLTRDHTVAAELVRAGVLPADEAAGHPGRNVLSRAVGAEDTVAPDLLTVRVGPGEALVLGSDGLAEVLGDDALGEVVRAAPGAGDAARALVEVAVRAGADDNVTAVVLRELASSGDGFAVR